MTPLATVRRLLLAVIVACGVTVGVLVWVSLDQATTTHPSSTVTVTRPVTHASTATVTRTATGRPSTSFGQPPVIIQPVPTVRPVTRTRVMTVPARRTVTRTRPKPAPTRRRTTPPASLPGLPLICGVLDVPQVCGGK